MIRTGTIESWTASPETLGPIYPFVGWEGAMILVVAGLWIAWTIWQMRGESAEYGRIRAVLREKEEQASPTKDSSPGR